MKIIQSKFPLYGKIPILLKTVYPIPVFLTLTYSILYLKSKSYKTQINVISAIKHFYQYFEQKSIDIDELIIKGDFNQIITSIDSYSVWLYNRQHVKIEKKIVKPISNQFFDINLQAIRDYLKWLAARYSKNNTIGSVIEAKINSHLIHITSNNNRRINKGLNLDEQKLLKAIVLPGSNSNPFHKEKQFRNWLIIELLLETGLRCGELLKLKTVDVIKTGNNYYIRIIKRSNDSEDTRSREPSLKNKYSERVISISEHWYTDFENYLINYRRNRKGGKKVKLNHGFVFTSERGNPLSQNMVNEIFFILNTVLKRKIPNTNTKLSPHTLRHTFAEVFLEYSIDVIGLDMERAKDELRRICGWSFTSPMPAFYAGNYIDRQANSHNIARIENAFRKEL